MKVEFFPEVGKDVVTDESGVFTSISFDDSGFIVIEGKSVRFTFPALVSARKTIDKMDRGPVRALFADILGRYRRAAEQYYKNNPTVLADHIDLGWVKNPMTNYGFVF